MKQTEHYGLNQWELSDRVRMEDFNQDNAKIDTALAALAGGVELAPEMHRVWFRGKNLGESPTEEQKTAIREGTFDDLYLGDYWENDGVKWRIADIDYWLHTGYVSDRVEKHHLVIMPDNGLYQAKMNETRTSSTGYLNSALHKTHLAQAEAIILNIFGSMVLSRREQFVSAADYGWTTRYEWSAEKVVIPNAIMMFGHTDLEEFRRFSSADNTGRPAVEYNISNSQLALFQIAPKFKVGKSKNGINYVDIWLRDIKSSTSFCVIANASGGFALEASSSEPMTPWVRPVFAIG